MRGREAIIIQGTLEERHNKPIPNIWILEKQGQTKEESEMPFDGYI